MTTVHDQCRHHVSRSLSRQRGAQSIRENVIPIWLAACTSGSMVGVRSQMRPATDRAASGSSPRVSALSAANAETASRSDQTGVGQENNRSIVAASWSGRSASTGPGATGRVLTRVRAENVDG